MALADEDIERLFDEECPGPADLGSVLVNDPISNAANYPPIVVAYRRPRALTLSDNGARRGDMIAPAKIEAAAGGEDD